MPAKKTYKDFETALARLEEVTEELESGEVKLEDAIKLYTEGLEIAAFCNQRLEDAEKKVKIITEKKGIMTEEDFEESEEG